MRTVIKGITQFLLLKKENQMILEPILSGISMTKKDGRAISI